MSTGWDLASDSPLLPFVDGATRRASFALTPAPRSPLPHVDGLLAGAAEVDLTPPPGMPKAGYSANAHTSRGLPHPPARPGDPPPQRGRLDAAGAVRPARWLVDRAAPRRPGHRRPHRRPARRRVHRRHPHPRGAGPVPRHRLLQPVRVEQERLRPGVRAVPRDADRVGRGSGPSTSGARRRWRSATARCGGSPATGRSTRTCRTRPSPTSAPSRSASSWPSTPPCTCCASTPPRPTAATSPWPPWWCSRSTAPGCRSTTTSTTPTCGPTSWASSGT